MGLRRFFVPSPRRTRALWALLAALGGVAAADAVHLWRQQRWNDLIAASQVADAAGPAVAAAAASATAVSTPPAAVSTPAAASASPAARPGGSEAASAADAASGPASGLDSPDAPPAVRFAAAHALAARGADEAAMQRYRALQDDTPLGRAARFNSANLLMRQAVTVRAGPQPGQAIALIELAKEMYREVLRAEPTDWPARYNLERAQRLLPEPDEPDIGAVDADRSAERAATTMRGYSPGLP